MGYSSGSRDMNGSHSVAVRCQMCWSGGQRDFPLKISTLTRMIGKLGSAGTVDRSAYM